METNCDRRSQKKEKKNSCTRIFLYSRFDSLEDENGSSSVIVDLERPIGKKAKKERKHEGGKTKCL